MEKVEMYVGRGQCLNDMPKLLTEYYNEEKALREIDGNTKNFVVFAKFNGVEILHTDTLDEMSVKVTGKTVAEQGTCRSYQK